MGGMSCDVNSGHMEGVPDHLDLVSNHQIGMVSSLKAHEAAIFSYLDWIESSIHTVFSNYPSIMVIIGLLQRDP